jgi:hypothetical protein
MLFQKLKKPYTYIWYFANCKYLKDSQKIEIILINMKLNLLSCDAQKPDRRAISKCIAEISSNIDESVSNQLTGILLDGDIVDIEMADKNSGSALRALRKLNIDYEIVE